MKRIWGWLYVIAAISWIGIMFNYGSGGGFPEFSRWLAMVLCVMFFSEHAVKEFTEE